MSVIRTARSCHSRCFICSRKGCLHKVKQESVHHALKYHNIYIKHDARSCYRHLDEN